MLRALLTAALGRTPHMLKDDMHEQVDRADITFSENGDVDVGQLNTL